MPDAWETQYGLNPNDPSDALLDADLDRAQAEPAHLGTEHARLEQHQLAGAVEVQREQVLALGALAQGQQLPVDRVAAVDETVAVVVVARELGVPTIVGARAAAAARCCCSEACSCPP